MRAHRMSPRGPAAVLGVLVVSAALTARAQQDPQEIRNRAADRVRMAHDALRRHDTGAAVEALRAAVGLLAQLSGGEMSLIEVAYGAAGGVMPEEDPVLQQLAFVLEAAAMPTLGAEPLGEAFGPEYERDVAAEEMKELKEEAEELLSQQEQVTEEIDELRKEPEEAEVETADQQAEEQDAEGAPEEGEAEAQAGADEAGAEGAQDQAQGEGQGEGEGDQPAADQAAQETAAKQAGIAENAARMADRLREIAGEEDAGTSEVADRFLAAAADAQTAAGRLRQEDFDAAYESAERAGKQLEDAIEGLKGMSKQEIGLLVDQALAKLERALTEQVEIRRKTEELADESPPGEKPDAKTQRDVKVLAPRQDEIRKLTESAEFDLAALHRWAQTEAKHETKQSILAAHSAARRGGVPQKMTNAIVAFSEFQLRAAAREQKAAEKGLRRIVEKVRDAYASMASDPLSELKAAEIEAQKIEDTLATLAGEGKPDRDAAEPQEAGEEAEGGERAESGERREGEELSPEERRRLGEQAASRIGRLARRIESRDFQVPEADMRRLTEVTRWRPGTLGRMAERRDGKVADLGDAARRVHDRLEEEYESALDARRLFQAQREECPPQYRPLVNKYFEVLSEVSR